MGRRASWPAKRRSSPIFLLLSLRPLHLLFRMNFGDRVPSAKVQHRSPRPRVHLLWAVALEMNVAREDRALHQISRLHFDFERLC